MTRLVGVALAIVALAVSEIRVAHAQASGSLQVEARVVDASGSWQSVQSTSDLARAWAADSIAAPRTLTTRLSRVDLASLPVPGAARGERHIRLTVQYLWN